jgi:membrane associated rhomboid family serine protease
VQRSNQPPQFHLPAPENAIKALLVANVAAFVVYLILLRAGLGWVQALSMQPDRLILDFQIWRPFTAMFLHSPFGVGHLAMNMLFLWIFGSDIERMLGARRFLRLYVACGLAGAGLDVMVTGVFHVLTPGGFLDGWSHETLGASGAVMGIAGYWCGSQWNQARQFLFLGQIKVSNFFYILLAVDLVGVLTFDNVAHFAHVGGLVFGMARARGLLKLPERDPRGDRKRRDALKRSSFRVIPGGRDGGDDDDDEWVH